MGVVNVVKSEDGTVKMTFDEGYVSAAIPQKNGKLTLCVSSQLGCALACVSCATSRMGFRRNLTAGEIVAQYKFCLDNLGKPTSVVFMGMGEPLLNCDNVMESIDMLNRDYGFSRKSATISTVGLIDGIRRLVREGCTVRLAVSLHSPFEDVRRELTPAARDNPLAELVKACNEYSTARKDGVMISYLMIHGVTDRDEDMSALLSLGWMGNTNFNLIPLNHFADSGGLRLPSSTERMEQFKEKIISEGYKCFIRETRGLDIGAACGMLDVS